MCPAATSSGTVVRVPVPPNGWALWAPGHHGKNGMTVGPGPDAPHPDKNKLSRVFPSVADPG
jgi:hypothetical protein